LGNLAQAFVWDGLVKVSFILSILIYGWNKSLC
jgi:hypothetical protein